MFRMVVLFMKKIVISGSSKLQDKVNYWLGYFKNKNYIILDYPKLIKQENYEKEYQKSMSIFIHLWKIQIYTS